MLVASDGNGNVTQVLKRSDGSLLARFEYDAYGSPVVAAETYAADMPLRFSSKWFDAESGLGYWGYRWYHARLGRWLSRDPIGEAGAQQLLRPVDERNEFLSAKLSKSRSEGDLHDYAWVKNNGVYWIDPDGAVSVAPPCCWPAYPPPNPPDDDYDCVGLACRTYTKGQSEDSMLQQFRVGGSCDLRCRPCEIKCWVWDYIESVKGPDGKNVKYSDGSETVKAGHIVCGQVGAYGSAPQCYDKFTTKGVLRGPGDCASFKPAESEPVAGLPGYQWVRSSFTCRAYCGPASAVPGLNR